MQGKYEQAEPLYQRTLLICEQRLGLGHPDTANSLNNLAGLYRLQGKYERAEPLYRQALVITEQQLGTKHPRTQQMMTNYLTLLLAIHTGGDLEALLQLLTQGESDDKNEGIVE